MDRFGKDFGYKDYIEGKPANILPSGGQSYYWQHWWDPFELDHDEFYYTVAERHHEPSYAITEQQYEPSYTVAKQWHEPSYAEA